MTLSPNLRGILWMVLGMAGFASLDTILKLLAGAIPTGQLLMVQSGGGALIFLLASRRYRPGAWAEPLRNPALLVRSLCEAMAAVCFVTALITAPLSIVAAIIQANPILVTLGAAIWLKEPVGPYRWSAIAAGLLGVLLVIRPWGETFDTGSLFAVAGVIFLSARDLLTRWVPPRIPTMQVGAVAMLAVAGAGAAIQLIPGTTLVEPDRPQWIYLGVSILLLVVGVFATTAAMRVGDVSVITPFRYSRLLFALVLAAIVFGERPDAITILGGLIIVAAGLFTLWREQVRHRA